MAPVLIVGGGVIGRAVAYELARQGGGSPPEGVPLLRRSGQRALVWSQAMARGIDSRSRWRTRLFRSARSRGLISPHRGLVAVGADQ